jgi:hypothetical protein
MTPKKTEGMQRLIDIISGYSVKEYEDKYHIKELDCEKFEVRMLARTTVSDRYVLIPKWVTSTKEIEALFPDEDFEGIPLFGQYIGKFLVVRTLSDALNGVTLEEVIDKRKLEVLEILKKPNAKRN